jgi:hypothetical protein
MPKTTLASHAVTLSAAIAAVSVPDGGFSIDPATGLPVSGGYAVAIYPEHGVILDQLTIGDLLEFTVRNADVLALPGSIFGGWRNPANGRIYLDVSIQVRREIDAIALGLIHDQLAIYDFAAGASILIGGTR